MSQESVEEYNTVRADIDRILTELKARINSDIYKEQHFDYKTGIKFMERSYSQANYDIPLQNTSSTSSELNWVLARLYGIRANGNLWLGFFEAARNDLEKALVINPQESEAYIALTGYNLVKQDYKEALNSINKGIEFSPIQDELYLLRATVYYRMENYQEALQSTLKGIELNPGEGLGYYWLGVSHIALEMWSQAEIAFDKTIELGVENIHILYLRGLACYQQNKYQEALEDLNRVLKAAPEHTQALILQANCYYQLKQFKAASKNYEKVKSPGLVDISLEKVHLVPLWLVGLVALLLIPLFYSTKDLIKLHTLPFAYCREPENYYVQLAAWLVLTAGLLLFIKFKNVSVKVIVRQIGVSTLAFAIIWGLMNLGELGANSLKNEALTLSCMWRTRPASELLASFFFLVLPLGIILEFLFRGFLFTQIYLRLKTPYKWLSAIAITQTYITLLFAIFILPGETTYDQAIRFLLTFYIMGGALCWIYLHSENIFLCASLSIMAGLHLLLFTFSGVAAIVHTIILSIVVITALKFRHNKGEIFILDNVNYKLGKVISPKSFVRLFILALLILGAILITMVVLETVFKSQIFGAVIVIALIGASWWYVPNEIRQLLDRKTKQAEAK
jgi:tetratricopeptide (TPR) repeat protein